MDATFFVFATIVKPCFVTIVKTSFHDCQNLFITIVTPFYHEVTVILSR